MRLRAHWNSRVKVPDLADTEGPVTESNCIGAIPPGGEQLEVKHQSLTASARMGGPSEPDSVGGSGEPASPGRSPNKIERPALRQWNASGREPRMVGDRMVGSSGDVNQGTTVGDDERTCRGQSVRSSIEASNDRGAKGRRKAVPGAGMRPSREGRRSAARLSASVWRKTAWPSFACWQWAARNGVSGSGRTARLVCSLRTSRNTCLSQPIDGCRLERCGRSACPVWEGGGAHCAPPILIGLLREAAAIVRTVVATPTDHCPLRYDTLINRPFTDTAPAQLEPGRNCGAGRPISRRGRTSPC